MARRRKRGGNILIENKKSKLVLILLTMTGLSFFGLDRIYSNQIGLGLLKLFTAGGFGIWYMIDAIRVVLNALTRSHEGLFGITGWTDDVNIAFNVTLALLLLHILGSLVGAIFYKMKNKNSSDKNSSDKNSSDKRTDKLPLLKKTKQTQKKEKQH